MAGTLIVGCGTLGCSVVSRLKDGDIPTLTLNWRNADVVLLPPDRASAPRTAKEAETILGPRANEIMMRFQTVTEVVAVIGAGSIIGDLLARMISGMNGGRFSLTVIAALPFRFEQDRRSSAIAMIKDYPELADRVFVMDLQYSGYGEMVIGDAMQAVGAYLATVAGTIADLMGTIPFMSTFSERTYTF